MPTRTLAEWLALQESVHPKTIDMGLERVTSVARALGVDKPPRPVITVGGTNGKGSTVAHLEALFRAMGASTGLFTSPHFIRYNERIRVNGTDVTDSELIAAFERIEAARGATTLTFFEFNTLAALLIFEERAVDVAILEVGLGGRLDATNLVDAEVAVLCSIGFDHRDWLGDSLDLIGAEKAGIFRTGQPAVLGTADMPESVYTGLARLSARAVIAGRDFSWRVEGQRWSYQGLNVSLRDLPPSALAGSIQFQNASAALAAVESLIVSPSAQAKGLRLRAALDEQSVSKALRTVRMAGRFQIVPGPVEWILDIAHNEPAARIFATHVRERPLPGSPPGTSGPRVDTGRTLAVVGILGDKDASAIGREVESLIDHWIVCTLPGPRGIAADELVRRLRLPADAVTLAPSVRAGCEIARNAAKPGDRVLVFGSVYTVGPALEWLGL